MALRKLTASDLGDAHYISAIVPMHRKGHARTLEARTLAYYPERGETAESAQAFADAIAASARAFGARRDAKLREPVSPLSPVCHHGQPDTGRHPEHVGCEHVHGRSPIISTPDDLAAIARLSAELDARKGRKPRASVIPPAELVTRKPRARKVAPARELAAIRAAIAEPEPEPEPVAPETPDSYGPEYAPVGYYDPIELAPGEIADATDPRDETPEPEPEPAAPVLTVVQPRTRPTCERCGQTFRVSGNGYAWHVANRPDCAAGRLAVVA